MLTFALLVISACLLGAGLALHDSGLDLGVLLVFLAGSTGIASFERYKKQMGDKRAGQKDPDK